MLRLACISISVVLILTGLLPAQESSPAEYFERSIRPLLADHCWECHGPNKQWNGLRLDSAEAIHRGGDSGPAVVPGQPSDSLLFQAVHAAGICKCRPRTR